MSTNAYLVKFEFEFACLAENETEAADFIKQALDDALCLEEDCSVTSLHRLPAGWKKSDLLYHSGSTDIPVGTYVKDNS